jgi:DNA-directed RNA polymerase subunit RPC12/RpoP
MSGRWYISCSKCGHSFHVSDGFEGMKVQCRQCKHRIYIPNETLILNIGKWISIPLFILIPLPLIPRIIAWFILMTIILALIGHFMNK